MAINHPYYDIAKNINIEKGETIILTANFSLIFYQAEKLKIDFDINKFIDTFIECISDSGNVIIPSFNWSFTSTGTTYDYKKTKTQTGLLGDTALLRNDFKRTLHPAYSHLIFGKDKDRLTSMHNINSYHTNSDFEEIYNLNAKYVLIGLQLKGFTYLHHFEQKYNVPYRYNKYFSGNYIDENNQLSKRKCAIFVRRLETGNSYYDSNMSNILLKNNAGKKFTFNDISHHTYDIKACEQYIKDDIMNNNSLSFNKFKDNYNPHYQDEKYIDLFVNNNFNTNDFFDLLKKEYFGELNILNNNEATINITGLSDDIIQKDITISSKAQLKDTIKEINDLYNLTNKEHTYIFNLHK